ncbi:MAG: oxidoreductase-like domain-containing protein [Candidatus Competibacteraceae bacterium]|nr:oxidoreductase-like domain-containing protein [Candidatus Competibacteraceae bacterium]
MSDDSQHPRPICEDLPPPPRRPDPDECCGGGCNPCIFDCYEEALENWQRQVEALSRRRSKPDQEKPTDS